MDHRDNGDVRLDLQHPPDIVGVDRRVVRHRQLDRLATIAPDVILEELPEDTGDEIQDARARFDRRCGSGLDARDRLGLQDHDVVRRVEDLLHHACRAVERLDEHGIVMVNNRLLHRAQRFVGYINRAGSKRQTGPMRHRGEVLSGFTSQQPDYRPEWADPRPDQRRNVWHNTRG